MGLGDKMKNTGEQLKGKAKKATGEAKDDEQLEREGKTEETKADLKQTGEKAKDVFRE